MTDGAIPTLQTERLVLRAPQRSDFEAYAAMLADPRTEYMGGPFSRNGAWDMFCNMIANWHLSGFGGWIIDTQHGDMVGEISLWHPDHFPEPELGWTLTAAAEGHGYALEAAHAARDWYWRATGASTLVSYVDRNNARSQTLAKRLGANLDPNGPFAVGDTPEDTAVFRHKRGVAA